MKRSFLASGMVGALSAAIWAGGCGSDSPSPAVSAGASAGAAGSSGTSGSGGAAGQGGSAGAAGKSGTGGTAGAAGAGGSAGSAGSCNNTPCDDGDPCTQNDLCNGGTCKGTQKVCDAPPPSTCSDAQHQQTWGSGTCSQGTCSYLPTDTLCLKGCVDNQCALPCDVVIEKVYDKGSNDYNERTAIRVGQDGVIHTSFRDNKTATLMYARKEGSNPWAATAVSPGARDPSMVLDAQQVPHLTYTSSAFGGAHAIRQGDGTWKEEVFTTGAGTDTAIAMDATNLYVAYYGSEPNEGYDHPKLAWRPLSGAAWTLEDIEIVNGGNSASMATDGAGNLMLVYQDFTNKDLRYAYRPAGGAWAFETADADGDAADETSLALDTAGGVHVAYLSSVYASVRHAYRPKGGTWSTETIENGVYEPMSIAVDAGGALHVAHFNATAKVLRYGHKKPGGAWEVWTVDADHTAGDTGQNPGLVVDGNGVVHIAYQNQAELKYARLTCTW